jgi:hypothetical protein
MKKTQSEADFEWNKEIWLASEMLASPRSVEREEALDYLVEQGAPAKSPLIAYLLATRLSDPDLGVRFHMVKTLGAVLIGAEHGEQLPDQVLRQLQSFLTHLNKEQILDLLEVSEQYLSAEESLIAIFKLCSYAGDVLSGIVNDRKISLEIRQNAIYYCGEIGFLETITTLQVLVMRIEKRNQLQSRSPLRKKAQDENQLYPYAVAALEKLGRGPSAGRETV